MFSKGEVISWILISGNCPLSQSRFWHEVALDARKHFDQVGICTAAVCQSSMEHLLKVCLDWTVRIHALTQLCLEYSEYHLQPILSRRYSDYRTLKTYPTDSWKIVNQCKETKKVLTCFSLVLTL